MTDFSDLRAGTTVYALDFPPTVQASDSTTIANISSTTYIAGTPEVGTTFTAPSSGRVRLIVSALARDNGATAERFLFVPQVFLGTSSSGSEVLGPAIRGRGMSTMGEATNYHAHDRSTMLEGLTPGATYYARTLYRVTGGTSVDCIYRGIIIVPLT